MVHSFRWRIVLIYLVIILSSLLIFRSLVIWVVESYLLTQEIDHARGQIEALAVEASPLMMASDADSMYEFCVQGGDTTDGRILLVDGDGIVQMDSHSQLNGVRLTYQETQNVLVRGDDFAYGYYRLNADSQTQSWFFRTARWLTGGNAEGEWVAYCAAPVTTESGLVGAVVLSLSIQGVVERMNHIGWQMTMLSIGISIIAFAISLMVSAGILRPVRTLTQSIQLMGRGDFSTRVNIRGRSEFAQMGRTFNNMAERLENLDKQRNQFVSNASHEMKTPLASVKILVETLQGMYPLDEDMTREFLSDINSEVDRMNRLITDLLSLAKREEIDPAKDFDEVDMAAVTRDVCRKLIPMARSRSITLTLTEPEEAWVEGNGGALEQMMVNLVDNAIKYTSEGGKVSVDIARNGRNWLLTVKDTGIGIAKEDIPYIFDRFYRVDKARSRATGGTGLGLAIVKDVVQHHGGNITVTSALGTGTTMRVVLPALD